MTRDLDELNPEFRKAVDLVLADLAHWCKEHLPGREPVVIETYRSQERQDALYAQGRTADGHIVTWTRNSKHTQRLAVDIGFSKTGRAGWWDAPEKAWKYYAHLARKHGLVAGYDFKNRDRPHIQMGE